MRKDDVIKLTGPYKEMAEVFVRENGFKEETVRKFAGPEYFSFSARLMLQMMFKTVAKKKYAQVVNEWGSSIPLLHLLCEM